MCSQTNSCHEQHCITCIISKMHKYFKPDGREGERTCKQSVSRAAWVSTDGPLVLQKHNSTLKFKRTNGDAEPLFADNTRSCLKDPAEIFYRTVHYYPGLKSRELVFFDWDRLYPESAEWGSPNPLASTRVRSVSPKVEFSSLSVVHLSHQDSIEVLTRAFELCPKCVAGYPGNADLK